MIRRVNHKLFDLRRTLADLATGPQALALLPLALLVGFWAGGGATLLVALLTLPALLVLAGIADRRHRAGAAGDGAGPVVADGRSLEEALDNILRKLRDRGGQAACLMLALDHFESVRNAQGARAAAAATDHVASRLRANLRRRGRRHKRRGTRGGRLRRAGRGARRRPRLGPSAASGGGGGGPCPAAGSGPAHAAAFRSRPGACEWRDHRLVPATALHRYGAGLRGRGAGALVPSTARCRAAGAIPAPAGT